MTWLRFALTDEQFSHYQLQHCYHHHHHNLHYKYYNTHHMEYDVTAAQKLR